MAIRRGEIYWIDFSPARGVEQAGQRPGLVVQNNLGNEFSSSTVVAAISTAYVRKAYPFVVSLPAGEGGLSRDSHVNCSQIMTVDQGRLGKRIGALGDGRMAEVAAALRYEFGI